MGVSYIRWIISNDMGDGRIKNPWVRSPAGNKNRTPFDVHIFVIPLELTLSIPDPATGQSYKI